MFPLKQLKKIHFFFLIQQDKNHGIIKFVLIYLLKQRIFLPVCKNNKI